MIEQDYKAVVDAQHAGEALIQKTLEQIRSVKNVSSTQSAPVKESRQKSPRVIWLRRISAAAACLVLVIGLLALFQPGRIVYSDVGGASVIGGGSLNLGQFGQASENLLSGIKHISLSDDALLPDGLIDGKPATLSGQKVYFGRNGDTLYAAFADDSGWELFYSAALSPDDFTAGIKTYLAKLS